MKKLLLFVVFVITALTVKAQTDEMFLESESRFGFEETVKTLTDAVTNGGWKVLIVHDLQESMKKAGKEVLPVKVFEICNPKYSYRLLSKDNERIYSSLMPCRFSVYEKSDGKVYISRMNTPMMSRQIGGLVDEVMSGANNDAESFIKTVTKQQQKAEFPKNANLFSLPDSVIYIQVYQTGFIRNLNDIFNKLKI